ncbi:MAG: iron-containing redox enzyme family protein [Defluviicoccus sp.]|nr:iron-containing redox enzyme family protein [Defluviicoccus sp.]
MSRETTIERLDAEVEDFVGRCLIFPEDAWTPNRCRAWVLQHRLNSRQRNSVLKLKTATNCPIWEIKLDIIHACSQEIVADHEFGGGEPHWRILEDLGVRIGMDRDEIQAAKPTPTTQLCWDAWMGLMANCHWLLGLIANTCSERVNVPGYGVGEAREKGWNAMVGERWREIWDLSEDDVRFFTLHTEADLEHSDLGWNTVAEYAEKLNLEDDVVEACRRNLVVWETYFNGICHLGDAMDAEGR